MAESALAYDRGNTLHARWLAVSLRKLLHHAPPSSKALLVTLGVRDNWHWRNSAIDVDPLSVIPQMGLVSLRTVQSEALGVSGPQFVPGFLAKTAMDGITYQGASMRTGKDAESPWPIPSEKLMPFDDWWNQLVARVLPEGHETSRKDLVLDVAGQEGAHVDTTIKDRHYPIMTGKGLGLTVEYSDGTTVPFTGSVTRPSIRQLAQEVIETVSREMPDFYEFPDDLTDLIGQP